LEKVSEIWSFFAKFIEEQAIDKVKLVRSRADNTIQAKLEAMEWMARYIRFVSPAAVTSINKEFRKEFMTAQSSP